MANPSAQRDDCRLIIFAKAPVAGEVKTRLQPLLSAEQAMQVHRLLVEHCITMAQTPALPSIELWVGSPHPWWQSFELPVFIQQGNDLGERMHHAASDALNRAQRVVIMGTDCPDLSADHLLASFEALDSFDAVLGPAEDGGYVSIGLSGAWREVFDNIAWGGDQVLQNTRNNLRAAGLSWHELPRLADIDRPEDLQRLLAGDSALARRLDACIRG